MKDVAKAAMVDAIAKDEARYENEQEIKKMNEKIKNLEKSVVIKDKTIHQLAKALYDKGYRDHCGMYMCTVATTCYDEETQKRICSRCIEEHFIQISRESTGDGNDIAY